MVAVRKDLVIDKGSVFEVSVRMKDSNDAVVDLSGYTTQFEISKINDRAVVIADSVPTVDDDNWINVKLTDEETDEIPVGKYLYMINVQNPSGDKQRLFTGEITVRL
ncbi:hypothetical protein [Rhodococcus opacus]|uniref:hypothetical protein n=1 Tax=Rhodococcus opacus TaxID=37919 RepID=UPI00100999F6|nr:hypothetical protein [Rhodococcus opacus]